MSRPIARRKSRPLWRLWALLFPFVSESLL
jgi:hypothetical protein